jgi:hypothetical protein
VRPAGPGAPPCGALIEYDHAQCEATLPSTCTSTCAFSAWADVGACTSSCGAPGSQLQRRTRTDGGVRDCSMYPLERTVPCATQPCGVACAVGSWGDWSPCTAACGGGSRARSRPVITHPTNGGAACPPLQEISTCGTAACTSNSTCELGPWSPWGACSRPCGGGEQTRQRVVVHPPTSSAVPCEALVERQACNAAPCVGDGNATCGTSEWSDWGVCTTTCITDRQTRTRTVLPGGGACRAPVLSQTQACTSPYCPAAVDCALSEWSLWSGCSVGCGAGTQLRYRRVDRTPLNGGAPCNVTIENRECVGAGNGTAACLPNAANVRCVGARARVPLDTRRGCRTGAASCLACACTCACTCACV